MEDIMLKGFGIRLDQTWSRRETIQFISTEVGKLVEAKEIHDLIFRIKVDYKDNEEDALR
jgi:hypothetical protein